VDDSGFVFLKSYQIGGVSQPKSGSKGIRSVTPSPDPCYQKLGENYYRYALDYSCLAAQKIKVSQGYADKYFQQPTKAITDFDPFDYGDDHSVFDES
jgi:hypothetical protein